MEFSLNPLNDGTALFKFPQGGTMNPDDGICVCREGLSQFPIYVFPPGHKSLCFRMKETEEF